MVFEIDNVEYRRGVEVLKFSVIGKLMLQQGDPIPTMMEIRRNLLDSWKINNLKFIYLGKEWSTFYSVV